MAGHSVLFPQTSLTFKFLPQDPGSRDFNVFWTLNVTFWNIPKFSKMVRRGTKIQQKGKEEESSISKSVAFVYSHTFSTDN